MVKNRAGEVAQMLKARLTTKNIMVKNKELKSNDTSLYLFIPV